MIRFFCGFLTQFGKNYTKNQQKIPFAKFHTKNHAQKSSHTKPQKKISNKELSKYVDLWPKKVVIICKNNLKSLLWMNLVMCSSFVQLLLTKIALLTQKKRNELQYRLVVFICPNWKKKELSIRQVFFIRWQRKRSKRHLNMPLGDDSFNYSISIQLSFHRLKKSIFFLYFFCNFKIWCSNYKT